MRVLQLVKHDEDRTQIADPEEIHEVIAKAWRDIFRRWDKEVEPACQHLWDTQQQMDMGEVEIDMVTQKMTAWGVKKTAGPDGWTQSEWKQITPEMLQRMRHILTGEQDTAAISMNKSCGVVWRCGLSLVTVTSITCFWMEGMNQQAPEIKATTMVDDRRLCVVSTEKFGILVEAIEHTKK